MRAKVIKIVERPSKYGSRFYYMFFKSEDGKSFRTCLSPVCNNFARWRKVIDDCSAGKEVLLDKLTVLGKGLIDADSVFKIMDGNQLEFLGDNKFKEVEK